MIRLRGFLSFLATHGAGETRACALDAALEDDGREVRSALRAQGIVRDGLPAGTVPCDGLGCAREVRAVASADADADAGARMLFGVCTRDPAECETIALTPRDLAQEIVSRDAFVAAVQRALKLAPRPGAATPRAADAPHVTPLGEETAGGARRDVLLAWTPDAHSTPAPLRALLAEAALDGRSPRVVTLADLADVLTIRDGQIAELPRLHTVPLAASPNPAPNAAPVADPAPAPSPAPSPLSSSPSPAPSRAPVLAGLPDYARWGEITLFEVDDESLLGIALGPRLRRISCIDFGLATLDGRQPIDVFVLLKTICQGNGNFTTRAFGTRENGKRLVSQLRTALRATFALEDDPFETYSYKDHCWKTKFRALAAAPKEVEAAIREATKSAPPRGPRGMGRE